MRLIAVGAYGAESPAVLVSDTQYVDVSDLTPAFDRAFFASGGLDRLAEHVPGRVQRGLLQDLRPNQRLGAPIAWPHQVLCIGLNYTDHARETGQAPPSEPIVFSKSPNTVVGPHDDIIIPRGSNKTDWEVELGIVVGRRCRYLPDEESARQAIAGYVLVNDVSEREFQLERGGQWMKGKSAPTFNPTGPCLVTADEFGDVDDLALWLDVNGVPRQRGNTRDMVFGCHELVRYLSHFMTLEPGDLINSGTPAGVGMGQRPPAYLAAGDIVELGGSGLGAQRHRVVAAATAEHAGMAAASE